MQQNSHDLDEIAFFHLLLQKTDEAYRRSDVIVKNGHWSYSVCGTPIYKEQGLIVGLNWGGGGTGEVFQAQVKYPNGNDIESYPFIKRLFPYLKAYLKVEDPKKLNYSNLCFFRSPHVDELTKKDWTLSSALFHNYAGYVRPAWILLATSGMDKALEVLELDQIELFKTGREKVFSACKARCSIAQKSIPFYAFPHPNAKVPGWVRDQLWGQVFS